jgi:hypothetical protein
VRPPQRAPRVSILTPADGWHFNPRVPATLTAKAAGLDSPVLRVDWLDETNLLQSVFVPPYRYDWSNAPLGTHVLMARAIDEAGEVGFSDPVTFEIGSVSVPLLGLRQPPSHAASEGDGVLWGVNHLGRGPISYRWFRGTQPIPGATNRFFFLNSLRPADAGEYWAEIRTHGSVSLSQVLTLTVHDAPEPSLVPTQTWGRLSIAAVNDGRVPILSLDARPGSDMLIESSVALTNWLPLLYLTNVSPRFYFTDPDPAAPNLLTRFYRAVSPQ